MNHFETLLTRYPALSACADEIQKAEKLNMLQGQVGILTLIKQVNI